MIASGSLLFSDMMFKERVLMEVFDTWQPSKYVVSNGILKASRDTDEVAISSRLVADMVAGFYAEAIPVHACGKLMDLGCGKAPLLATYAPFVDDAVRVDWGGHGTQHVDVIHDLNNPLPFEDASFDTILFSDVLEHMQNPAACMAEIARVLRPSGALIMNVPFLYWIHEQPHDYFRYTEFTLKRLVSESGFSLVELQALGGPFEVIADVTAKTFSSMNPPRRRIAGLVMKLAIVMLKIGKVQALSARLSRSFPIGYALVARRA
jgi:SAM-dependent methyltransferase